MPHTLWGRFLLYAYLVGYALRLALIGFVAWDALPLLMWWRFMAWQSARQALWPLLALFEAWG
jgi:hypothetical protein